MPLEAQVFQLSSTSSFEVLAVAESFWQLYSTIFAGGVNNGQEENCSLFETFFSQFLEKMLRRGWIERFAFVTRLPAGKWPSVRFAIQRTNKNSKLVAVSR